MITIGLCVLMVIGSSLLYETAIGWVQFQAVPRKDGNLVPWQWVIMMGVRGLALTMGTAVAVVWLPWWFTVPTSLLLLGIGVAAWPVAIHVNECRKALAEKAEIGLASSNSRMSAATVAWLNAERPTHAQVENLVQQNEQIAVQLRSRGRGPQASLLTHA